MVPPFPSLVSQKIISKGFLYETVLGRAFKIPSMVAYNSAMLNSSFITE